MQVSIARRKEGWVFEHRTATALDDNNSPCILSSGEEKVTVIRRKWGGRRWEAGEAARSMKLQGMTEREGGGADDKDIFPETPFLSKKESQRDRRLPSKTQSSC